MYKIIQLLIIKRYQILFQKSDTVCIKNIIINASYLKKEYNLMYYSHSIVAGGFELMS